MQLSNQEKQALADLNLAIENFNKSLPTFEQATKNINKAIRSIGKYNPNPSNSIGLEKESK